MRWLLAVVVVTACGCASSPPPPRYDGAPAFPLHEPMLFPLVRPLDGSVLVTPVRVGDKGYFLFQLDPFAPRTKIDGDLVGHGADDNTARVELGLGKIAQTVDAQLIDARTLDRGGLDVWGVIGSDILRDDLLFGVDRSAGYAWLASDASYRRPAVAYDYLALNGGARVLARVGGELRDLRIDLTARHHALSYRLWPARDFDDPLGAPPSGTAVASMTVLGQWIAPAVFDPYNASDADGVLGMAFFAPYDFVLDRNLHVFYLTERGRPTGSPIPRIARWGPTPCPHAGCVSIEAVNDADHHGVRVRRDPAAAHIPLEVTLAAVDVPDMPLLVVNMPADVRAWTVAVDQRYLGHALQLVDMSPFPPPCAERTGDQCVGVDELAQATAPPHATTTLAEPETDDPVGSELDRELVRELGR